MKEKLFYSDSFNLTPGDFDQYLRLKPYSIFNLFQEVTTKASKVNLGKDLQDRSWRLIRTKYIILKQPGLSKRVIVETRPLPAHISDYRREFRITSTDHLLLVKGSSIWCVDNLKNEFARDPMLDEDLDISSFIADELPVINHQVRASDLDFFLHLNAAKYGEVIFDAMNLSKKEFIKQIQINFLNPASNGEVISIFRANIENKYFLIGKVASKVIFQAFVKTNFE